MGLIARAIEERGIPTGTLAVSRAQIAGTRPPRVLLAPFPRGQTIGPPGDAATRCALLAQAPGLFHATVAGIVMEYVPPS